MPDYIFECDRASPVTLYATVVDAPDEQAALEELKFALDDCVVPILENLEDGKERESNTGKGRVEYADVHVNRWRVKTSDIVAGPRTRGDPSSKPDLGDLRPSVELFVLEMETELRKHDETKHLAGWRTATPQQLLACLKAKVAELEKAVAYGRKIRGSAVDVGNYAMILHDVFVQKNFD